MMGQAIWINNNNNNSNNNTILLSVMLSGTGWWAFIAHRRRGLHGGGVYLKPYCFENVFVAVKSDPAPSESMHHQLQITQYIFIRKHSINDVQTCFRDSPRLDSRARDEHPSLRGTTRCRRRLPIMKFRLWIRQV